MPPTQTAAFDGTEMVEQLWLTPAEALARSAEMKLMTPTQKTLELVARYATVDELLAWARSPRDVPLTMPRVGRGSQGMRPVLPDEHAWAELGRIDPAGHGHGCYDIEPGVAVRLSPRADPRQRQQRQHDDRARHQHLPRRRRRGQRVGGDRPGPARRPRMCEAILAAAPGPIRWIFVTHTHNDHSPATRAAAGAHRRAGARPRGGAPASGRTRASCRDIAAGRRRTLRAAAATARCVAIHTPGHASNHLCYLLDEEKTLFTGDHVMQASTVVINPPDGDMAAYLRSLRELQEHDLDWLAPGHGFLMAQPKQAMQAIVAHRLKREAKVVAAMQLARAGRRPKRLLAAVYDDVPPRLHAMAMRSLTAHLFKLRDDGAAAERGGVWSLSPR